jgi:hypothetical protein
MKENEKVNLFLVRSPLQALNAIEVKERFVPNETNVVVLFYRKEYDKDLMMKVLDLSDWSKIYMQKLTPHLQLWRFLRTIKKRYPQIHYCGIGDFNHLINRFMHTLSYDKLILLEDGTATLRRAEQLNDRILHTMVKTEFIPEKKWKIILNRWAKTDPTYLYDATLFTIYPLEKYRNIKTIVNDYRVMKGRVRTFPREETAYFIGTDIQEWFKDRELFEEYMRHIAEYSKKRGLELRYILHRKEDAEWIGRLADRFGFTCEKFENIIEVELLKREVLPREISTFISTALTTLPLLYPTEYRYIAIDPDDLLPKFRKPVAEIEAYFLKNGIAAVKLSD